MAGQHRLARERERIEAEAPGWVCLCICSCTTRHWHVDTDLCEPCLAAVREGIILCLC